MGDYISMGAGTALFIVSLMVMKSYWPSRGQPRDSAYYLCWAIFLGFGSDAANALWWQMVVGASARFDLIAFETLRPIGLYLDGIIKGSAAYAGYLHLRSQQDAIPKPNKYHWFDMPWHPKRLRLRGFTSGDEK